MSRKRHRSEDEENHHQTDGDHSSHKRAKRDQTPSNFSEQQSHAFAGGSPPDQRQHDLGHLGEREDRSDVVQEHPDNDVSVAEESQNDGEVSELNLTEPHVQPKTTQLECQSNSPELFQQNEPITPFPHGHIPPLVKPLHAGAHDDGPDDDAGIDKVEIKRATHCVV